MREFDFQPFESPEFDAAMDELRKAELCPPDDCPSCEFAELCGFVRSCVADEGTEGE